MITQEVKAMEEVVVSAITHNKKEAKVSLIRIEDKPGTAAAVFKFLGENNINVDMIVQNVGESGLANISFTIERTDVPYFKKLESKIREFITVETILYDERIAKVSAVGVGMRSHAGVAASMFSAFAEKNINILMIGTSEIKTSCVIHEDYTELAVRALCEEFGLEKSEEE
jgi:aspartate kinase